MENQQLKELMQKRKQAQEKLLLTMQSLEGANPMTLMMKPAALSGVFDALKESAAFNDQLVTELAVRALNHGD